MPTNVHHLASGDRAGRARTRATCARAAVAALAAALLAVAGRAAAAELESSYLFRLADVYGAIQMSWASLTYDPAAHELYVVDRRAGEVRVFGASGMQEQSFGGDDAFGTIVDVAVAPDGDLYVLCYRARQAVVLHCDFRGTPLGTVALTGVPASFAGAFDPSFIRFRDGRLWLADASRLRVLVADPAGRTLETRELLSQLKLDPKKRESAQMTGFDVDAQGDVLFTVGPLFLAVVAPPSGPLRAFGTRGSSPGKFNVVGAITTDEHGNVWVTDVLRAVVMAFTPSLEFAGEFGYRGWGPDNLVTPVALAVHDGRAYVSQGANRGVSVFRVSVWGTGAGQARVALLSSSQSMQQSNP